MAHLKFTVGNLIGLILAAPLSCPVFAMQAMDDGALSKVSGRDGISVSLNTGAAGWTADTAKVTLDSGTASQASLSFNTISLTGTNSDGSISGANPASGVLTFDAGADGSGNPLLSLGAKTTNRIRLQANSLTIPSQPSVAGRSFGTWAMDFDGQIKLTNNGIFNIGYNHAYLYGKIDNANLFYRQGSASNAWMAMHDFNLMWELPDGTIGLDGQGLVQRAGSPWKVGDGTPGAPTNSDLINLALDFEYIFGKQSGGEEFQVTSADRGLMHFGWLGSVKNAELKWTTDGIWSGATDYADTAATTTRGLRLSTQWDFVSASDAASLGDPNKEFRWRLGETADVASADQSQMNFELGDWTMWGNRTAAKPAALYVPMVSLDVINGQGEGAPALCWGEATATCGGGQLVDVQPGYISGIYNDGTTSLAANSGDAGAIALIMRDAQLQAYSQKVTLLETDAGGTVSSRKFNWGLIYSLANVNANIYLYPGGSGSAGSINNGVIADIALSSQTLADDGSNQQGFNWDHGTHLMIADTDAQMGIGFMSSSFLLAANDTRIWVKNQTGADYYSGGLDFFSPQARFNYSATFGGGLLPDNAAYNPGSTTVPQTVNGALLDINLEGMVNLRLSPSDPNESNNPNNARNFLAYSGALRLGNNSGTPNFDGATSTSGYGTYLSIAEPSQPSSAIRLANITGDIAFTNGMVDIVGTGEQAGSPEPKMVIANDIQIGYAAKGRLDEAVAGTNVSLGAAQPLEINQIMLGDATLGSMIIPSARIHSSITLEPQSAAVPFTP
ncbi:MAG: hypothetical protein R3292_05780 [Alcanivorax sp.]|nr:hypothetical protein [Alcanivorax sp.]